MIHDEGGRTEDCQGTAPGTGRSTATVKSRVLCQATRLSLSACLSVSAAERQCDPRGMFAGPSGEAGAGWRVSMVECA